MPDVKDSAAQVGDMLIHALQNTFGMSPSEAIAHAQAETGVSDSTVANADFGQALDYACGQPGLTPETQSYLANASANYNSYGNVNQSGGYASGGNNGGNYGGSNGGGGYSGGSGGGGAAASSNAQLIQQVTQNYNYQEINDNHIDVLGPVNGSIDIDQDNDDIHDIGDGNAINTGDGVQNAATGDHSAASQSEEGNAVSNTGDNSVTSGDDTYLDHSAVGTGNTVVDGSGSEGDTNVATQGSSVLDNQGDGDVATGQGSILDNRDGSIDDHSADHGGVSLDNSDGGSIDDSSLGFGSGNVQGDVTNEEGAANSQGGNANGTSVNVNVDSQTNTEHGPGDLNDNDDFGKGHHAPVLQPLDTPDVPHLSADHSDETHLQDVQQDVPVHAEAEPEPQHEEIQHEEVQHVAEAETHDDGGHEGADHMLDDHAIG
jgi:hypothetical protein